MSKGFDLQKLLDVIEDVAAGHYSQDIIKLTAEGGDEDLRRIAEAMSMMMVKVEAREYRLELIIEELREARTRQQMAVQTAIEAMAEAINARDEYTAGHGYRVAVLSEKLALSMGLDQQEVNLISLAALIHDIGKIGFSDAVFHNTIGKPPPEVMAEIVKHPQTGFEILKGLDFLGRALDYIYCHHERLDGTGYPRGLAAEDIPQGARIVAVADTYDAITTNRPYQKGSSPEKALEIMTNLAGKALDPDVVNHLRMITIENTD